MKILKVIHGYPMIYNAGSEVYSQTLCNELSKNHEVHVFTREEDSFKPDYHLRKDLDTLDKRTVIHIVNNPRNKDRYISSEIDKRFKEVLEEVNPDIVHIGHLNHLSTSLVFEIPLNTPVIYTLHDYWLMCPRGQFMQMFPEDSHNLWPACDGQEDEKCALRCYSRYFSGDMEHYERDLNYWTNWVNKRMEHIKSVAQRVDVFISPSQYLLKRYHQFFGIPTEKLIYLDYGFDLNRFKNRERKRKKAFTFGYIGTHIPAKGIHDLIKAFRKVKGNAALKIWGRPRGQDTESLKKLALSSDQGNINSIEWLGEYCNNNIVENVFNEVDAIIVPSVWVENSPLVIHEAQQAGIPVITGNAGGMSEYVHHEVNGLLFEHRSFMSLAEQMQRFVDNPDLAVELGKKGYLFSDNGSIPSIDDHAVEVEKIYLRHIKNKKDDNNTSDQGPWRITFDTNPDTCNLNCIMCEEHSKLNPENHKEYKKQARNMPFETIERVVSEAAPYGLKEIIPSTMGEPLLYKQFNKFFELCQKYNIKLNLTTNGTFPGYDVEELSKKLVQVTSDIKVSLNGSRKLTQEKIMTGSNWEESIQNVKTLLAARDAEAEKGGNRCQITLQVTFMTENVKDLPEIVSLAIQLGVDRVKGHHLWVHFKEMEVLSLRQNKETIRVWNKTVKEIKKIVSQNKLPNGRTLKLDNIFPLNENNIDEIVPGGECPFLGKEAWINAEGRFDPCCAPDKMRQTLGYFGNVSNGGIMRIWNGEAYKTLKETYHQKDLCKKCNMRKPSI